MFLGLPIFTWYYAVVKGWFQTSTAKVPGIAASLAYLTAWVYIQYR